MRRTFTSLLFRLLTLITFKYSKTVKYLDTRGYEITQCLSKILKQILVTYLYTIPCPLQLPVIFELLKAVVMP